MSPHIIAASVVTLSLKIKEFRSTQTKEEIAIIANNPMTVACDSTYSVRYTISMTFQP